MYVFNILGKMGSRALVLSRVHTGNIVEATFEFVEATFDFVAKTATMSKQCSSSSKESFDL